jgi:hypothetical protein
MKLVSAIAVGVAAAYFADAYLYYGTYARAAMQLMRQILIHFSM